jgi:hypothetical protein
MVLFGLPVMLQTNQNGGFVFLTNFARGKRHTGEKIADFERVCKSPFG